jgi:hypothetical protein
MKAQNQSWQRAKRYSYSSVSAAFKRTIRSAAFFIADLNSIVGEIGNHVGNYSSGR